MSARNLSGPRKKVPLIVFAGRSNVGKSSTIRVLTGMKVRVGKKPGSTRWEQEIDMGSVKFVDIPGFGYMRGQSKEEIDQTKDRIIKNLEEWREQLALAVLIIDISLFRELFERWDARGEIPIDVEFYSFLSEISPAVIVVANKVDKLKKREAQREIAYLEQKLVDAVPTKPPNIVVTAASKKMGATKLQKMIESLLKSGGISPPDW
ncbi:MAG: GTP-binding protein EngB [Candidatus Thorarchaeota archaeon]